MDDFEAQLSNKQPGGQFSTIVSYSMIESFWVYFEIFGN